ncbi:MAG TPA: heme peroxidase family protein [Gemmatimonadaceae bacterium]|nr:heme peroxidase family protein [Gemmatimonadaceae bacterium]
MASKRKNTRGAGKETRRQSRSSTLKRVKDPLKKVKNAGPNMSAFERPARIPKRLDEFDEAGRRRLVSRLIESPVPEPPEPVQQLVQALRPPVKRFHGMKVPIKWYPGALIKSPCADKFCYMFPPSVRNATRLPFNATTQALLTDLGNLMGDVGRENGGDSIIPAGYTYFGQFVDHDITLDVSSTLDSPQDATKITNMRTPALDLDSVYGRGPALDPFLYRFPPGGLPPTAVKLQLGRNRPQGFGGPLNAANAGTVPVNFDVPRVLSGTNTLVNTNDSTFTAIIGDPRNDENVIVSQFHHAMLKFHNEVVDLLVSAAFNGDIFTEARKIVRHHYQWAVLNDFLPRICGSAAVDKALHSVTPAVGSRFCMPVEFAVAAYRFGHSMIRDGYILNPFLPPSASTLVGIFDFIRVPLLPLFSNWAVDFNMFFTTAHPAPGFNNARKIDSNLAPGLEQIPGPPGIMKILAARNLRRGLALGLPSGQGVATFFGITPMTTAELTAGLPQAEITLLNKNNGMLLNKTPLWYYVLREAMVLKNGDELGPVGGRIVAETFVRMLRRDADSFMNVPGFTPSLPSSTPGTFTIADMLEFSGVLVQ